MAQRGSVTSAGTPTARWPGPASARSAALVFALVALVLGITVWQSSLHLAPAEAGLLPRVTLEHGDEVLGPWLFWDANAHHDIAENGYTDADVEVFDSGGQARVAYFAGYPMVVRAASVALGDIALAEVLVTFASGLGAVVLLQAWFARRIDPGAAQLALLAVVLFPWAFFLVGAGYGDALFLLSTVGAFGLLERDRPLAAGAAGAVAALTRPVGLAVILGLALLAAEKREALTWSRWRPRLDRARFRPADRGVLLAASGLIAYMVFCWVRYGDPVAFSTAQRGWNQAPGPHTWFKLVFVDLVLHEPDLFFVLRLAVHGLVLLLFCAAIPAVWRRFGPAYGTYTLVVLALPAIGSAAFASQGRYVLAAFPVFGLLGERLAHWSRRRTVGYLCGSGLVLLLVASSWGRGYWMG